MAEDHWYLYIMCWAAGEDGHAAAAAAAAAAASNGLHGSSAAAAAAAAAASQGVKSFRTCTFAAYILSVAEHSWWCAADHETTS